MPISAAITNIESIIFNKSTPAPLTTVLFGETVTILSSDIFSIAGVQASLDIARAFASVLIVASWLYGMRKKIVGGA